ncbi:hypothetical protein GDO86_019322 [Hymenochirus boettgeri]|uniref:Solute carrier family 35 member G1 n=1 Tax=Hymenochirus boettgeri TaxID=247094 RepID=A0A8T2IK49_9PIPI|nr:hypothetical protein GDO86_019322 [Hymenochirus boettgeri]
MCREDPEVTDPSGTTQVTLPGDECVLPGESRWEDPGDIHCPQRRTYRSYLPSTWVIVTDHQTGERKCVCPGLAIFYTMLASVFFSSSSLLVKKIGDLHSVEISAIRCIFQMMLILPGLIYFKTGFLGPKEQRIFLFLRGFLGSGAMILMYYAVQSMPLADATVIAFSRPAFTCIFACIFLKEKCTVWDIVFILFTITGVILIARPPFLFGSQLEDLEVNYTDRLKGTMAALASAVGVSLTIVVLRRTGRSVHYLLSVWYYAIIGLIECVIALSVLGEWKIPACGTDRLFLILIGILGLGGQICLVKALQVEKAGPVAIMRTMDVVFAFIFQAVFLNHTPTLWTVGGALCIVASTAGTAIVNIYKNSSKAKQNELFQLRKILHVNGP